MSSDKDLLEAFAEFCHDHYTGCQKNDEQWEYCYEAEITTMVDAFLDKMKGERLASV